MAHILAISSQTVYGPVGNSASVPALEYLGHTVHALPTVVLSHHPGHGPPAGLRLPGRDLGAMLGSLEALGVLDSCGGVFTGYFAADEQVHAVERVIRLLKRRVPGLFYFCDPIIGDDPDGLYVPPAVAEAVRERLLPMADIVAPNRFELAWLSQRDVTSTASAVEAARALGRAEVLVSSVPAASGTIATLAVTRDDVDEALNAELPEVPRGTGDLLSGLYFGGRLNGLAARVALVQSMAILEKVIAASAGKPALDLVTGLRAARAS